jgi:3-methylfumaryl-CoA hydratase
MSSIDIAHLRQWVGRKETTTDTLAEAQVERLALTLDHARVPRVGDLLPPLWHWIYFTPRAPRSKIGVDGHPKLGGFMPPVPLPRRMWAGGRLIFHAPLRVGETVSRDTEILSLADKPGKQGALIFLTLRHVLSNEKGVAIEEEQDIVYREPNLTTQPPPAVGRLAAAQWREAVIPDPTLLFRYSAVTFNTHRIHYDLPYATKTEGYPALVVQGPLTATLLAGALMRHVGRPLAAFSFRGQAPLFADQVVHMCGASDGEAGGYRLWAEGSGGYTAMSASARLAHC